MNDFKQQLPKNSAICAWARLTAGAATIQQLCKPLLSVALALTFALVSTDAQALIIGGQNYERFLGARTADGNQHLGYWLAMNSYDNNGYVANNVIETFLDPTLASFDVAKIHVWGTTQYAFGPIKSGNVEVFDANGVTLLKASIATTGTLTAFVGNNISVTGLYNVTGGQWLTEGLISSQIYAEATYGIFNWNGKDIHAANGIFNFYHIPGETPPPPGEVPEPMTLGLLLPSLVGLALRKKI